jgi:hypothetical protein
MKKRRHSLSLLELVVGFTLFALLSSFLMIAFTTTSKSSILFQRVRKSIEAEEHLCFHMQKVLNLIKEGEDSMTLLSPSSLKIEMKGYLDESPYFMDEVSALFFLRGQKLMLQLTSKLDKSIKRELLLLDGILDLSYEFFYYSPKTSQSIVSLSSKIKQTPASFSIYLKNSEEEIKRMSFFLPPHRVCSVAEGVIP